MPKLWVPDSEFVLYCHQSGRYLGRHAIDSSCTRRALIEALVHYRTNNDLPGVHSFVRQPTEITMYVQMEGTITVIYPEEINRVH